MPKKSFTLHLAKHATNDFESLLSAKAIERLPDKNTHIFELDSFVEGSKLIVFGGIPMEPPWYKDLKQAFGISQVIRTSSASALLFFMATEKLFVASFAHGWMFLNDDLFEADFGLRTVLNSVDEGKLKRLERAHLGDALRAVALSPFQRDFRSFGIDDALDLVRKISGEAREDSCAHSMSGARSLKISCDGSIDDLPEIAQECLEAYNSESYKKTSFRIIDVVSPVQDINQIKELDLLLLESVRLKQGEFELSLPETSENDTVAYKFAGPGLRRSFPDLVLENYLEALGGSAEVDIEKLKKHRVVAVYGEPGQPDRSWSIRKGLIGSLATDGRRYALNEGEWYRIDETFKNSIEQTFRSLIEDWPEPPIPLQKNYDEKGNGRYQTEESYNQEIAYRERHILFDRALISVPDIQGSAFEICDLLYLRNKRFIHVKKSSRKSSVLSHFFKQGANAAQQLKKFPSISTLLLEKVREIEGQVAADKLSALVADGTRKWGIEFRIADAPRANGEFNIPFFSKITLRNEVQDLSAMGFDVFIRFIPLAPDRV